MVLVNDRDGQSIPAGDQRIPLNLHATAARTEKSDACRTGDIYDSTDKFHIRKSKII
ncbi:hypothetical protein SAMN02745181_0720 [Rubritalea squalenifaciens DSM 18772]|uniref:Uncharacterized protein n=2 Tax=Rubritalea TaxID=361050 RepID=A0A1M6DFE0_9BACT|nr:hypothetical protein SAMN02745181_0720 [Rubritalea squalenifaciens DSM 18772]